MAGLGFKRHWFKFISHFKVLKSLEEVILEIKRPHEKGLKSVTCHDVSRIIE